MSTIGKPIESRIIDPQLLNLEKVVSVITTFPCPFARPMSELKSWKKFWNLQLLNVNVPAEEMVERVSEYWNLNKDPP